MIEKSLHIPTAAGSVDTFVCHPERRLPAPGIDKPLAERHWERLFNLFARSLA